MFVYGKYYQDGSCILLSSNAEWMKYHIAKEYPVPAPVPLNLLDKPEAFHIIPADGLFQKAKYDLIQKYNSDQAIDFIIKGKHYYEVICFAFSVGHKDVINTIVNNLAAFKRFTSIFKDQARQLLQHAENHRIMLPAHMIGLDFNKVAFKSPVNDQLTEAQYQLQKTYNKHFTQRQIDILYYTARGKTANETALHLGLSPRTIEHYLINIKNKIGASSKSELIHKSIDCLRDLFDSPI